MGVRVTHVRAGWRGVRPGRGAAASKRSARDGASAGKHGGVSRGVSGPALTRSTAGKRGTVERVARAKRVDHHKLPDYLSRLCWTGGRVVEGTGLENRHTVYA